MKIKKWLLWTLVALNGILGTLGLWFFYKQELAQAPKLLWIFVPDSPLFAIFFVISILLIKYKKEASWFLLLTSIGLIKYGISAAIIHAGYLNQLTFPMILVSIYVIISHVVMAGETIFLTPNIKQKIILLAIIGVTSFFFLNDYLDFFAQKPLVLVPIIASYKIGSISMTIISTAIVILLIKKPLRVTVH